MTELVVALTLLTVFMAMFTGVIVMMNRAMTKSQAINDSSSQLNIAFQQLDTFVRYAAFISTPGLATGTSGNWYVELRTTWSGTETCTQLRLDIASQQLQSRTWTVANSTAGTASAWLPIASGLSNGNAVAGATTQPFYLVPPQGNALFQQLRVNLTAPAGPASSVTTSATTFTFTALNSTVPASSASICQQQGRP